MLRLRVFGGLTLDGDGLLLTGSAVQRRPLAVLAVLAVAGERGLSRDRLMALFWPESDAERARSVLKQTLYALRRDLRAPELVLGSADLRLNPAVVASDVAEFERAIARDDPAAAVAAYAGPFLDGVHVAGAAEFERWADGERERLAARFATAAEQLAERAAAAGDPLGAVVLWRRLAAHDPFSGRVAAGLMRALAAAGDRAGALQHARLHAALLRSELEIAPGPEVTELERALQLPPPTVGRAPVRADASAAAPVQDAGTGAGGAGAADDAAAPGVEPGIAAPRTAAAGRRGIRGRWLVAGAAVAAALLGAALLAPDRDAASLAAGLDPSLYLVAPCRQAAGAPSELLGDGQCELLLYNGLRRWQDVRVVEDLRVRDALAASRPPSLGRLLALARAEGARHLVWGSMRRLGGDLVIRAALYDAADGSLRHEESIRAAGTLDSLEAQFRALTVTLLAGERGQPVDGADVSTTRLRAWLAYVQARRALGAWDLAGATEALRAAIADDSSFAMAHLWLAQVTHWRAGRDADPEIAVAAARALSHGARLPPRERLRATALLALARGELPRACAAYDTLLQADSLEFAWWFGRAECHARDQAVVRDPASPSGWSFRGSAEAAAISYARAFALHPPAYDVLREDGFLRLTRLLPTEPNRARLGYAADDSTSLFMAYPGWSGDTITFVPHPIGARTQPAEPPSRSVALSRNRERLRAITRGWVASHPRSAAAHEAYALALEVNGEITAAGRLDRPALEENARALALSGDALQRLRLRISHVRLLLKAGRWAEAGAAADSLLADGGARTSAAAERLAPVAALLGRAHDAAALLRQAAPHAPAPPWSRAGARPPMPLIAAAQSLLVYASFDAHRDSLAASYARVERLIAQTVDARHLPAWRDWLLAEPLHLALLQLPDTLAVAPLPREDRLLRVQALLRSGNRGAATALLARHAPRADAAASPLPSEALLEGTLRLALGDTAGAAEVTDVALAVLPTASLALLDRVNVAAAVPRLLARAAALARSRGDARAAQRRAGELAALWAGGDVEHRAVLDSLRRPPPAGRR